MDAGISKKIESDDKEVEKVIIKMLNMVSSNCNCNVVVCICQVPACLVQIRQAATSQVLHQAVTGLGRSQTAACANIHSEIAHVTCCSQLYSNTDPCGAEEHMLQFEVIG